MDTDIDRLYTSFTWLGAPTANDVRLEEWLHPFVTGWSGEHLYLATPQDNHTVEIGDKVEYAVVGEGNSYVEYITVRKPESV